MVCKMPTIENLEEFVNGIFADGEINQEQLKEALIFCARQLFDLQTIEQISPEHISLEISPKTNEAVEAEGMVEEENEPSSNTARIGRIKYLNQLIKSCEERLGKLIETPKTRVVIRNEGKTLESIIERLDCVCRVNCCLQAQIKELAASHEKIKQLECERRLKYQDLIDKLYQESVKSDVCNLRKLYYGLQDQVNRLIVKCTEMGKLLKKVAEKVKMVDEIPELREKINKLLDWRASLREDLDLLCERYEHVKTVKVGKCEVDDLLKNKVNYCHLAKYVRKSMFDDARHEFAEEFSVIKELFCELQLVLSEKMVALHKDVQCVKGILAKKRVSKIPPK